MKIENFIAIYGKEPSPFIINIPFYPDEINEGFSAEWSTASVVGRPVPVGVYTGSGYRTVSINFDMHRELDPNIDVMIKELRNTVYSVRSEDGYIPKFVIISIGEFVAKGYITSVSYAWKKPIIDDKYQVCTIGIQMNAIDMGKDSN